MAGPQSYREWLTQYLAPTWLRGLWGSRLLGVLGDAADREVTAAKDAVKCRFVAEAPSDALGYVGDGRNIERYWADSDATYRTRLQSGWTVWEFAGTPTGLLARLGDAGLTNARIASWRDLQPAAPHPYEDHWSAFWIFVAQPHPFVVDTSLWGDPGTWGDTVSGHNGAPAGPGTWGSDATLYEVQAIRALIGKWKAAHEICPRIFFVVSGDVWEPVAPWANGTWSDASVFSWVVSDA